MGAIVLLIAPMGRSYRRPFLPGLELIRVQIMASQ